VKDREGGSRVMCGWGGEVEIGMAMLSWWGVGVEWHVLLYGRILALN
jgi:hypothetical protein